jgi:hypothetical protein
MKTSKTLVKNEKTTARKTVRKNVKPENKKTQPVKVRDAIKAENAELLNYDDLTAGSSESSPVGEYFNTSELAAKYELDRATVRKRLRIVGIEPSVKKAKENLYLMTDDLEDALLDEGNPELDAARLRKLNVETELKMIELKVKNGEYGSALDFSAEVFKLIRGLHRKCTITLPRTLAKKLARMKDEMQISQLLADEYDGAFQEAREEHDKRVEKQFGITAKV